MPSPGAQRGDVNIGRGGFTGDEPDWVGAAAAADQDVGMGGGGFVPVGNPMNIRAGPDLPPGFDASLQAADSIGGMMPVANEDAIDAYIAQQNAIAAQAAQQAAAAQAAKQQAGPRLPTSGRPMSPINVPAQVVQQPPTGMAPDPTWAGVPRAVVPDQTADQTGFDIANQTLNQAQPPGRSALDIARAMRQDQERANAEMQAKIDVQQIQDGGPWRGQSTQGFDPVQRFNEPTGEQLWADFLDEHNLTDETVLAQKGAEEEEFYFGDSQDFQVPETQADLSLSGFELANQGLNKALAGSVRASDVTQAFPPEWSQPDEWGMPETRLDERSRGPGNVSDQDVLGQQTMDPTARRDWQIQNPLPLASSRPGPIASHFPSPLASSRRGGFGTQFADANPTPPPGAGIIRTGVGQDITDPNYDRNSQMAEIDAIMAQQAAQRYGSDLSAPLIPGGGPTPSQAQDAIGPPGIGGNNFYGMVTDPTPDVDPIQEPMVASQAAAGADWSVSEVKDIDQYITDEIDLDIIKNEDDAAAAVNKALTEKDDPASKKAAAASKKLSKADKKANLEAMKDVWKDWVDYKDVLWENVEKAREKHGFWSEKAREASDDYQLWMGSDFYSKALARTDPGKAQQMLAKIPYLGSLGSKGLKGLQYVEDIFHGFGKTERRPAEKVLNDMKTDPGKYETKGEGGAYYLREMYPFLSNAPDDVVTNALNSGPYLRYLLALQMGGQRMPRMYDPNWGGDNSWLYAD